MIYRILKKACVAVALCGSVMAPALAADATAKTTLGNLQAAYTVGSNARVRYAKFAVKADAEGYKQVAALFRAASKAEEIRAGNYAKQIIKLKAQPKSVMVKVAVKTTKENLESALKDETNAKDAMYPDFAKQAEADKNMGAVMTFKGVIAGEAELTKLFTEALGNLEAWKAPVKEFLVCTVCGYATSDTTLKQCPVCSAHPRKIRIV